ncbi:hypothetical protein J7560_01865 [Wohlfahrtiimonas chitiniclastica]|uniref:hypothetical protein n=1 Tax=Wohlfahrtiimonas chitiniclastica TaxID=400946 RepID=UPI001BCD519B|nr:hypothetical protein [Wohlfahrtiimonas chitiniclastica]MBS7814172.1 hypothetical protein [Wohlfahrtiimonas chitiniclastica]
MILVSGCALHPISVQPELAQVEIKKISPKIPVTVGYYISEELLSFKLITAGSGVGDNVSFYPYKDLSVGYGQILESIFKQVVKLPSIPDDVEMKRLGIKYVIQPKVSVTSGGSALSMTWPPEYFTVELISNVKDTRGILIANPKVKGHGTQQEVELLYSDFGYPGKIAMKKALLQVPNSLIQYREYFKK